jgi:hypothetical protein
MTSTRPVVWDMLWSAKITCCSTEQASHPGLSFFSS